MNTNGDVHSSAPHTASGKSKKNKKRKNKQPAAKLNGEQPVLNGHEQRSEVDNAASDDDLDSPAGEDYERTVDSATTSDQKTPQSSSGREPNGHSSMALDAEFAETLKRIEPANVTHAMKVSSPEEDLADVVADTERRLEAAVQERNQLRLDVTELRKALEQIQQRHNEEIVNIQEDVVNTQSNNQQRHDEEISALQSKLERARLTGEEQYEEELGRVKTELEQVRAQARLDYEDTIAQLKTQAQDDLADAAQRHNSETATLIHHHEEILSSTRHRHDEDMSKLKAQLDELRLSLQQVHGEEISDLKNQFAEASSIAEQRHNVEVSTLKLQLTEVATKMEQQHDEDISQLKTQLDEAHSAKEHAESQYHKLLGKVNTIKAQLGERLKADAADLAQARLQIEELEERNKSITEDNHSLQSRIVNLTTDKEQQALEIQTLRSRANLSQQNWAKERDDMLTQEAQLREEFDSAKQAMQDWEVLAMEERSVREGLSDRIAELEDHLSTQREAHERAASERDAQSLTVDGLQRALREIQDARKVELREIVEHTQTQLVEVKKQLKLAEDSSTASQSELEEVKEELARVLPIEKEVKEKNLLIGKLRHEAVILNDHLNKALRYLKRGKTDDTVDRQLVTNHFLQFLAIDRADPKKFQVLQLISAILGWSEEQNEVAGLARPGASSQPMNPNSSLRGPMTPFLRRVSSSASMTSPVNLSSVFTSTPSLGSMPEGVAESPSAKESLAELWSSFLDRETGRREDVHHSRQSSSGGIATVGSRRETVVSPTSGRSTPRP